MAVAPVVALVPGGWAIRFDGTSECGQAIAAQLWPDVEAGALAQRWAFRNKGTTTWSNPATTRGPLHGEAGDWVASYGGRHHVVKSIPADWLNGVSAFTRNILDEWERR